MIWLHVLFAFALIYALSEDENPFAQPALWLFGVPIAIYWFMRWRRNRKDADATRLTPEPPTTGSIPSAYLGPELDMFEGLRGWKEEDTPAQVATASCALSGRSPTYLRTLLVAASLRANTTLAARARTW